MKRLERYSKRAQYIQRLAISCHDRTSRRPFLFIRSYGETSYADIRAIVRIGGSRLTTIERNTVENGRYEETDVFCRMRSKSRLKHIRRK